MKLTLLAASAGIAAAFSGAMPAPAVCGACIDGDFDALTKANIAIAMDYQDIVWQQKDVAGASNKYLTDATAQRSEGGDGIAANIAGMSGYLDYFPDLYVIMKRVVGQGEYVVTHSEVHHEIGDAGWLTIDIFHIVDGMIADHWDFQQMMEVAPYPFGNTNGYWGDYSMMPQESCEMTQTSLDAVNGFMKGFYVTPLQTVAQYTRLAKTFYNQDMIEHNPDGATGMDGYLGFVGALVEYFPRWQWQQVTTIAQGEFVVVVSYVQKDPTAGPYTTEPQMSIGTEFGRPEVVVDVFRVDATTKKIAEHWDLFASYEYYLTKTADHKEDMLVFL